MSARVLQLLSAASADPTDADLLARFVATRDEAAFAELVRRHGPAVLRVCRRVAGPASADDAFQAAFLVLACRAKSVRKAGSVGSWLIGVAGRVARQLRRQSRRQGTGDRRQNEPGSERSWLSSASCPLSPVSCLLSQELAAVLDDELSRLPERLRGPVVLCHLHGRTHEQAAAELGGSVRTLRRRLDRAKAVLRARLERRGVVPAVAAGLVAGMGPVAAVPPELTRRAVEGVFEFLAGGGRHTPAAVVAKGVVGNMANLKASVLLAATAAMMIALGVGWAGDTHPPGPPTVPPQSIPALGPIPVALDFGFPLTAGGGAVHRTANFVVTAPTAVVARAVAAEAEFQRKEVARRLLGSELPDWPAPCEVRVVLDAPNRGSVSVMEYGTDAAGKPTAKVARMELRGPFLTVLTDLTPHEVTHTVVHSFLKKQPPRWADEGIAMLAESADEQLNHDVRCRELLNAGRGFRLRTLFRLTEYPQDMMVLYAQGYSVCRFLLARPGPALGTPPVLSEIPYLARLFKNVPASPERRLMAFVVLGTERGNTAESWDTAAKQVYGFESVDALEEAWLESLKAPPAKPKPPAPAKPDLIPPANLPGVRAEVVPLGEHAYAISSRTWRLPINLPESERGQVRQVQVYVSRNEGKTWERTAEVGPKETEADFRVPADGLYWLSAVMVYHDGRRHPPQLTDLQPMLKLLVDTTPPEVRVTAARREGARVRVEWAVEEKNPAHFLPAVVSFRTVEDKDTKWTAVEARPGDTAVTFDPKTDRPVDVRVTVKDQAGNVGVSAMRLVD